MRTITKCAVALGALALPLTLPLATAAPASATTGGTGSAFAIAAAGPVAIPATPSVSSDAQRPERESVAELPNNPLVRASALNAAAWSGHARASVADLVLPRLGLKAAAVTAKCENGNGVSHLAKASLDGRRLQANAKPNSTVEIAVPKLGDASVVLNRHVRDRDGSLTVTAIQVRVPLPGGKTQTIDIASATCGKAADAPGGPGGPGKTPGGPGAPSAEPSAPPSSTPAVPTSPAPVPTPVTGDLPVTG
ncbi:choice-of-anchor P family protein [Actinomadura sediminis]|uniref:Choice-of-anchor P family protein n=1 Tax=Actinomadura sediminis TaxID=1038904 RepID=A0ABW3EUG9_9ACTN